LAVERESDDAFFAVGSQSAWRVAILLTAVLQNSHQNGGRVFLIFVADPRTLLM
jgi:hypothetical protein